MSEQIPYQSPQENDDLSVCCKKIPADKRKIGFYITLFIGGILYLTAIINFLVLYLVEIFHICMP